MTDMSPSLGRRLLRSHKSVADWVLGSLGVGMATASASFAGYMIATAPAEVTGYGSKNFTVFVGFDRRKPRDPGAAPAGQAPVAVAAAPEARPTRAADPGIDPVATGSIPPRVAGVTRVAPASASASGATSLREFRVRDAYGDRALIEHSSGVTLVRPGSILAGAGEVLAIERQGDGWIVRTASGVIGGS